MDTHTHAARCWSGLPRRQTPPSLPPTGATGGQSTADPRHTHTLSLSSISTDGDATHQWVSALLTHHNGLPQRPPRWPLSLMNPEVSDARDLRRTSTHRPVLPRRTHTRRPHFMAHVSSKWHACVEFHWAFRGVAVFMSESVSYLFYLTPDLWGTFCRAVNRLNWAEGSH